MNIIKSKKQMFIVIGAFALILLLGTASYAFFNYTRTGETNTVGIGRIYFNTDQGNDTLTLTNIFPMTSTQANTANLDSVAVHIQGDTTYNDGEEFEITLVNVTNTVNGKTMPINYTATYVASENKEIGTSSDSYFTSRGSSSNVYQFTSTGEVSEGKQVLVGFIPKDGEVDGTLTIKAYIDSSKVVISDTLQDGAIEVTGYNNGYPNPGEGVTVLTTAEWNALQGAGSLKFSVREIANEGTWVSEPPVRYIAGVKCQRVTSTAKLHTETCTQTSNNCYADGYTGNNSTITYGNLGTTGTLAAGDAFDCDVNGDGIVNVDANNNSTERFYYVSRYYDTNTQTFDNTYATLIYYSDTYNGVASTNGVAYYASANENWHGPVTAITHLPTTTQWSNIQLKTTSRTILACDNADCSNTPVLTTNNGSNQIENPFSYTGRAARLLTLPELVNGCKGTINNNTSLSTNGSLTACNFLFEGTKYADSSKATSGPWLETPLASYSHIVWFASAYYRRVGNSYAFSTGDGARPAIDVAISDIDY